MARELVSGFRSVFVIAALLTGCAVDLDSAAEEETPVSSRAALPAGGQGEAAAQSVAAPAAAEATSGPEATSEMSARATRCIIRDWCIDRNGRTITGRLSAVFGYDSSNRPTYYCCSR